MILSSLYTLTAFAGMAYGAEPQEEATEEEFVTEEDEVDIWRVDDDSQENDSFEEEPLEESGSEGSALEDDVVSEDESTLDGDDPEDTEPGPEGAGLELLDVLSPLDGEIELLADDLMPEVIDLIMQDIKMTDLDGNPLSEPCAPDQDVRVTYYFTLAENAKKGDVAYIDLPQELWVSAQVQFELKTPEGQALMSAYYDSANHRLVMTFEDDLDAEEVSGLYVYFDGNFDEESLNHNDVTTIILGTNSNGEQITVTVEPPDVTITITKNGQFMGYLSQYDAYVVAWTLIINDEDRTVSNPSVTDTLPNGLKYIDGTISATPADIAWNTTFDSSSNNLGISYSGTISKTYTVTFLSEITDFDAMPTITSGGLTYHVANNTANLQYETYYGTKYDSDSAKVNTSSNLLFKTGEYNYNTKTIEWELVVNQDRMTISNAVLSDSLPSGLTLDSGSVEIFPTEGSGFSSTPLSGAALDAAVSSISESGNSFSIHFTSPLTEAYKITYSTAVDAEFFDENNNTVFNNYAQLTGGFGAGMGGPFVVNVPVDAYSVMLMKTAGGYTQDTQIIKWNIAVNNNRLALPDAVTVEDTLDTRVTYLPESLVVKANGMELNASQYTVVTPAESSDGLTLTIVFDEGLNGISGSIYFETRVSDLNILTDGRATIENSADLYYHKDLVSSSNAEQPVSTRAIQKDVTEYDYTKKTVTWQITVNPQLWPITGEGNTVTDYLPEGMVPVDGSIQYRIGSSGAWTDMSQEISVPGETYTYTYDDEDGQILFHLKDLYKTTIYLKVTTVVTEEYLEAEFGSNGVKDFTNRVVLYVEETGKTASDDSTYGMDNTVVGKSGDYDAKEGYIEWKIVINSNALPWDLSGATITDQLQDGLELDTSTVTLTSHQLYADGTYSDAAVATVPLTGSNVSYDSGTNLFVFTFPDDLDWEYVYILTFQTDVLESGSYSNAIEFEGKIEESDCSEEIVVNISGGGGGITLNPRKYNLTIQKVDEDSGEPVPGAEFTVLDQYGNQYVKGTTGSDGTLVLNGLTYGADYELAELTAPGGYIALTETVTFTAAKHSGVVTLDADDGENITFTLEKDQTITARAVNKQTELHLIKIDGDCQEPICGVTFTLTETGAESPSFTGETDEDGAITFRGLRLNTEYVLSEGQTPEGYIQTSEELSFMLIQDDNGTIGVKITSKNSEDSHYTVDCDTLTITVTNTKTRLVLTKVDVENGKLLAGAIFEICGEDGEEPHVVVSGENGEAVFEGLAYDVIYTVRELTAPAGYVPIEDFTIMLVAEASDVPDIPEGTIIILINEERTTAVMDVVNRQTKILVEKIRAGQPDMKLAGAEFAIYDGETLVAEIGPTGSDGLLEVAGLEYGVIYRLTETKAPSGYRVGADVLFRLVNEDVESYRDEDGVMVLPATLVTCDGPASITVENTRRSTGGGGGGGNPGTGEPGGGGNPGTGEPGGGGENPGTGEPGGGGGNPGTGEPGGGGGNPGTGEPGGGGGNPGTGEPGGPSEPCEPGGNGHDTTPKTGIADYSMLYVLLAALAAGAVMLACLGSKKKISR